MNKCLWVCNTGHVFSKKLTQTISKIVLSRIIDEVNGRLLSNFTYVVYYYIFYTI